MSRTNGRVNLQRAADHGTWAGQGGSRGSRGVPYSVQELVCYKFPNENPTSTSNTVRTKECRQVAAARKAQQVASKTLSEAARAVIEARIAASRTAAAGKRTAAVAASIKIVGGSKAAAAEMRAAAEGLRVAAAKARTSAVKARAAAEKAKSAMAEAYTRIAAQRGRSRETRSTVHGRGGRTDVQMALPEGETVPVHGSDPQVFQLDGQQ